MVVDKHSYIKAPLAMLLLIATALLSGCSDNNAPLVKGQPTPEFSLQNLQGHSVHFPGQFEHQVILISFWADWCPSCKKEMRDFETLFQQYKKQGLSVLAINVAQDKDTAMAFIDDLNLSYQVLLDTNGDVAKAYSISSLPSALIIDRRGNLHTRILGETPAEVFKQILSSLL